MLIPLFPLSDVLFPGGVLALQIFEVRYLHMIGRCWREQQPFGVTLLTQGTEVRRPDSRVESFHSMGTMASIEEWTSPQPGLMLIRCRGTRRFRILASQLAMTGAWGAEVQELEDDPMVAVPEHLLPTALGLRKVYASLDNKSLTPNSASEASLRFDDCGWVANRWCELLTIPAEVRQQLMTLDNPLIRLELVTDLLRQASAAEPPRDS